jgi:ADP-ribose pyrophosphatase YjhB (NUDIX family)
MQLFTAGLLVVQNRKLLLAYSNNKKCFYLPGGKINKGETAAVALCREINEELNVEINPEDLEFYVHITASAYGENEGVVMEQDCFFTNTKVNPTPAAEIGALQYFSLASYLLQSSTAPGAILVLEKLQAEDLID